MRRTRAADALKALPRACMSWKHERVHLVRLPVVQTRTASGNVTADTERDARLVAQQGRERPLRAVRRQLSRGRPRAEAGELPQRPGHAGPGPRRRRRRQRPGGAVPGGAAVTVALFATAVVDDLDEGHEVVWQSHRGVPEALLRLPDRLARSPGCQLTHRLPEQCPATCTVPLLQSSKSLAGRCIGQMRYAVSTAQHRVRTWGAPLHGTRTCLPMCTRRTPEALTLACWRPRVAVPPHNTSLNICVYNINICESVNTCSHCAWSHERVGR